MLILLDVLVTVVLVVLSPLVRSLFNTFSAMKQVNEGRRITVGTRDHVGIDTEVLLRKIQKAKSDAGDKQFRWKK